MPPRNKVALILFVDVLGALCALVYIYRRHKKTTREFRFLPVIMLRHALWFRDFRPSPSRKYGMPYPIKACPIFLDGRLHPAQNFQGMTCIGGFTQIKSKAHALSFRISSFTTLKNTASAMIQGACPIRDALYSRRPWEAVKLALLVLMFRMKQKKRPPNQNSKPGVYPIVAAVVYVA